MTDESDGPGGPTSARRFVRADGVVWRRSGEAVIALAADAGDSEVVELSGTGVALWDVLAEPVDLDGAAAALADAYRVPASVIAADIAPVLDELVDWGVVTQLDLSP